MGDPQAVSFQNYQIGPQRTSQILGRLRESMHAQNLNASVGRDDLDRYQLAGRGTLSDGQGQMAFRGVSEWFSDGIRYHLYFRLAGFRCGGDRQCTDASRRAGGPDAGGSVQLPENARGEAFLPRELYRGDFNADGRVDFMVVLENGSAMVFQQRP